MKLAGLEPSGVLCELTNVDGTMARLPRICEFAKEHSMPVLSIEDLVHYLLQQQHQNLQVQLTGASC